MTTKYKYIFVFFILIGFFTHSQAKAEKECFEKVSRSIFKFNEGLDKAVIGPVARVYNKLPSKVREGAGNFTSNIATLLSIPNQILQGNIQGAGHSLGSFMVNTTVGIFGIGDPASAFGVKDTKEDLSQTLGVYGVQNGCYFVLPVLGPTTARDAIAMFGDTFLDPFATMTWRQKEVLNNTGEKMDYIAVKGTAAVDFRANNDKNFESLKKNSLDLYSATKSLYLQNKKRKILNSKETQDEDWGSLDN